MSSAIRWFLIGIAVLCSLVAVVIAVFVGTFTFSFRPGPAEEVHVVGEETQQRYQVRDLPVLGGDGARMWGIYNADTQEQIGKVTSDEGFADDNPSVYRVLTEKEGALFNPPMFYKQLTKELFIGTSTQTSY